MEPAPCLPPPCLEEDDLLEYMDVDDEIDIVDWSADEDTASFDRVVGCLEDILVDAEFEEARISFCRSHCHHFEDSYENQLVYTDLFSEYTLLLESAIERKVCVAIPGFSMAEFTRKLMGARKEELALDVFDLLTSLGDFATFKQLMLAYRKEAAQDAGARLTVECKKMKLHKESQEDGDVRPELDNGLVISPAASLQAPLPVQMPQAI